MRELAGARVLTVGDGFRAAAALDGLSWRHVPHVAAAAAALEQHGADAVVVDERLIQGDGDSIRRLHQVAPGLPILVRPPLTEHAPDGLLREVRDAIELHRLRTANASLAAELQAERNRFHNIIDRNADGIVVVDGQGTVAFANDAAAALFGRNRDELVGEPFGFPITRGEDAELEVIRAGGVPVQVEARVVESAWLGEPASIVMLRDVTDRRAAEQLALEQAARKAAEAAGERLAELAEEKRRLYEEARDANRAKQDFLAVMSHELRTPLNAVFGFADLLTAGVAGPITEPQREYVTRINSAARHLLTLVDEILDYAKLEAGRERLRIEDTQLGELLRESVAAVEPSARRKGLTLEVSSPEPEVVWRTDPSKVRQILLNLVGNAVKFTPRGSVAVHARATEDAVHIEVNDTGIGIAPEHQESVFAPFWQKEPANTRERDGVGLGLSIALRLTELLDGTIQMRSHPGDGSSFTLTFPRSLAAPEA